MGDSPHFAGKNSTNRKNYLKMLRFLTEKMQPPSKILSTSLIKTTSKNEIQKWISFSEIFYNNKTFQLRNIPKTINRMSGSQILKPSILTMSTSLYKANKIFYHYLHRKKELKQQQKHKRL